MRTTFTIDGKTYDALHMDDLTFDQAEDLERVTGEAYDVIRSDEKVLGRMSVTRALLWLSMRVQDPELKYRDLGGLRLSDVVFERIPEEGDEVEDGEGEADTANPQSSESPDGTD